MAAVEQSGILRSTEVYKDQEAEFIESLVREEGKKKGYMRVLWPLSIAACILLFLAIALNRGSDVPQGTLVKKQDAAKYRDQFAPPVIQQKDPTPQHRVPPKNENDKEELLVDKVKPVIAEEPRDTMPALIVEKKLTPTPMSTEDTLKSMIAEAQKKPRYKITIAEGSADKLGYDVFDYVEKRYSMADVLNHKDGISLSKFLQNPNSRIITDKATNKVTIEYIAEDHSVLVLTLSH